MQRSHIPPDGNALHRFVVGHAFFVTRDTLRAGKRPPFPVQLIPVSGCITFRNGLTMDTSNSADLAGLFHRLPHVGRLLEHQLWEAAGGLSLNRDRKSVV